MAGKRVSRGVVAASYDNPGELFYVIDSSTGQKFLVDSGSSYSIIPFSSHRPTSGPQLMAANRRLIKCWGFQRSRISFGGWTYQWRFLRADV
jgi:hypothetical protein